MLNFWSFTFLLFLAMGLSSSSEAAEFYSLEQHPAVLKPNWMEKSVKLMISARGQKLFSEDLTLVLANMGLVINEQHFSEFRYVSNKPIRLEKLAQESPKEFAILMQIRQFFRQYLKGLQFKDFRPSLRMGPSQYHAEFERLSVTVDEKLMSRLGKTEGAIFVVEVSISNLEGTADKIEAKDLGNPWMGQIGVQNPILKVGTKRTPLRARIPYYVRFDQNGQLHFEALQFEDNFKTVPIELSYEKILLPEYEFRVSGQPESYKISINNKEFKKIVDQNLPEGLKRVRNYVRDFLQNEFPKILNEQARVFLKDKVEQIQSLEAAGTEPGDPRPPLAFGMKIVDLKILNSSILLQLDSFVEDTTVSTATPFWQNSGARGQPNFNHLDPKAFDLAIAADRSVFNRVIQLSFNRKNFKRMETCPGSPTIELLQPPGIDAIQLKKTFSDLETPVVLYIDGLVESPANYTGGLFSPLKEKVRIKFKYHALLKPLSAGSSKLGIFRLGPDVSTLQVDETSLTWVGRLVKTKVFSEIAKNLAQSAACSANEPIAEFELINSLWGIPVEFVKVKMDPQGQMVFYLSYRK